MILVETLSQHGDWRVLFNSLPDTEVVAKAATGAQAIIRTRDAGLG